MIAPRISVVMATFNRPHGVQRLLREFSTQTFAAHDFEVIVVDDGSEPPVATSLGTMPVPFSLTLLAQPNAGPAAARDHGIRHARAPLIVSIDDDMSVGPRFLASHAAAHAADEPCVVLGRLQVPPDAPLPLFEQFHVASIERRAQEYREGRSVPGGALYSGNVSFHRHDYLRVGGFDPQFRLSEDAELGLRFASAGLRLVACDEAWAIHHSENSSGTAWLRRTRNYGGADARVAAKHPSLTTANPWRFLFEVHAVSRPVMLLSALVPSVGDTLAKVALTTSRGIDAIGLRRIALAGTTFTYGAQYFAGMGAHYSDRRTARQALRRYLNMAQPATLGIVGRCAKCFADIRADHEALVRGDAKYQGESRRPASLLSDAIRRIGFQIMIAYRVMRLFRSLRLTPVAMLIARMMRHLYSVDIHWDADLAPGVIIVHGIGLVISGEARVGSGCILFQHVTLGVSMVGGVSGAPTLDDNVHVGPGATVLGPIRVGRDSKIVANSVLMESVEPNSVVGPSPTVTRARVERPTIGE